MVDIHIVNNPAKNAVFDVFPRPKPNLIFFLLLVNLATLKVK